ncbi:MAG: hypothetical protein V5B40_07790 [Candidatus Accumulibacter meliphilus]|jgi:hypothetical protein|uniref:hypothetical protein n=1 Tax=Candidatus Accumulibacter meliphilus TaxID=2211374 RepID=UPI002FC2AB75
MQMASPLVTRLVTTLVAALAASLFAMPAIAQAGSGKDTTTTMDGTSAAMQGAGYRRGMLGTRGPSDCSLTKDPEQCVARRAAHRQVYEACRDKPGSELEQCLHQQAEQIDCTQARIPAQCVQRKAAYALCKGKTGAPFRNCVLQETLPADCGSASNAAVCQRQDKARKLCAAKSGSQHRQCVLDVLGVEQ